jgi:hypothetical protein
VGCPGCWRVALFSDPQQQRYMHELHPCYPGCHDVTTVADFFVVNEDAALRNELIQMIMSRHFATPRHQQVELGPSELGHPCSRHLAYALTNDPLPRCNPQWDPLPSIIGVAVHAWLAEAAELANTVLGRERWLAENKVHPADWLSGSSDLFDTDTGTVIDWKVPGVNQFALLSREMSPIYETQVQLYGKGFQLAGHAVEKVAIMLLPRGGTLSKAHLWCQPYNEQIADAAIERRQRIVEQLKIFDVHAHPERYEWFERRPYQCVFCPWFSPNPASPIQCPGAGITFAP